MGKRILVVDDEKNIRLLLEQALTTVGYQTAAAIDGEQGLEKVQQEKPDLVLLDMKLPGIDGIEVLRRLRLIAPTLPVVMITAHGTVETAVEAMKLGAIDYLRKPFTPDEIRSIVAKVLARQGLVTEPPAGTVAEILEQAKLLLSRRQFDDGVALLRKAASLSPSSAETLNLLGVAEEMLGHLQEAGRYFRAALSFEPGYQPAQQNLHRVTQWPYYSQGVETDLRPSKGERPEA